ncbi:MAG: amidase family protein, partial [Akkermansiaceae bacterium]
YDAYYNKAQKVRHLIRQDFENAYKEVDAILCPVTPNVAPLIGADKDNPLQQYLADIFTISANLAGVCGISVPCGSITSESGSQLPVGLQILGPHMGEQAILKTAQALESAMQPVEPSA